MPNSSGDDRSGLNRSQPDRSTSADGAGQAPSLLQPVSSGEVSSLAAALEPALRVACQGRLSEVGWFRSAWQAGGASTGLAQFTLDDDQRVDVVVKLPVGPVEYRWTTALGGMPHVSERITDGPIDGAEAHLVELSTACACAMGPTPRVFAAGTEIGGHDLAWLVIERFPGEPLHKHLSREAFEDLLLSAGEWYAAAERIRPVSSASIPTGKDWEGLIEKGRAAIPDSDLQDAEQWKDAIRTVQKHLPRLLREWNSRELNTWCHGDLHPGNAMRRAGAWWFAGHHSADHGSTALAGANHVLTPASAPMSAPCPPTAGASARVAARGGCVLIDLALVHPGHWVEDAVYLERLFWGRPDAFGGLKPVSFLAQTRRDLGLSCDDDYTRLANVRRVLMAACVPAFLRHEGHPRYVSAALGVLQRSLPMVVGR